MTTVNLQIPTEPHTFNPASRTRTAATGRNTCEPFAKIMTTPKNLWTVVLPILIACNNAPAFNQVTNSSQDTSQSYSGYLVEVGKKVINNSGNYFMLTKGTDTTVRLAWGNDTLERNYAEPLEMMFAERLKLQWENKDYLILRYGTGSGAWTNVVLPLNRQEEVQTFYNGLCFDSSFNLLGTEEMGDTIVAVHNLKTGQSQFITESGKPCDAAGNSACIDTIGISNKELYYGWVTPHIYSESKKSEERRVLLKI